MLILEKLTTVYGKKHYFINYQHIMVLVQIFINILGNMHKKVHLSVRLPNDITQSFSSNTGLKQGCNLMPILFNIFVNDVNEIFDKTFC